MVATVGTTSSTSIDPVRAMADLAERYDMWLHIDAAYAGSAAILPECRHILDGAERAHSLVVNAHKWLFTPIDLSAFYTRKPDILRRAFSLIPEYLRASEDPRAINLMDYGVPLGRRFRALKLWFVMRYFGLEGLQKLLRAHIAWAQRLAALVDADPHFERVAPVPFSVVCFRHKAGDDANCRIEEGDQRAGQVLHLAHRVEWPLCTARRHRQSGHHLARRRGVVARDSGARVGCSAGWLITTMPLERKSMGKTISPNPYQLWQGRNRFPVR